VGAARHVDVVEVEHRQRIGRRLGGVRGGGATGGLVLGELSLLALALAGEGLLLEAPPLLVGAFPLDA
jgi:hypothetical protein